MAPNPKTIEEMLQTIEVRKAYQDLLFVMALWPQSPMTPAQIMTVLARQYHNEEFSPQLLYRHLQIKGERGWFRKIGMREWALNVNGHLLAAKYEWPKWFAEWPDLKIKEDTLFDLPLMKLMSPSQLKLWRLQNLPKKLEALDDKEPEKSPLATDQENII